MARKKQLTKRQTNRNASAPKPKTEPGVRKKKAKQPPPMAPPKPRIEPTKPIGVSSGNWKELQKAADSFCRDALDGFAGMAMTRDRKAQTVTELRGNLDSAVPSGAPWFVGIAGGKFQWSPAPNSALYKGLHTPEAGTTTETPEG